MRHLVYLLIFLVMWSGVNAQTGVLDSLEAALKEASDKKVKSDILHQMASEMWDYDFDKGYDFASQAYQMAVSAPARGLQPGPDERQPDDAGGLGTQDARP